MLLALKYVASTLLVLLGTYIIIMNYVIFVQGLRGKRTASMGWWLGGVSAAGGLALAPWLTNKTWVGLPLLLDLTCAPMLVILPVMLVWRRLKRRDDPGEIQ
ncbi:MAG: hypothetical protein ACK5ZG_06295 [Phycisphaerae bacterium]|jgi:hypothetical protein